MRDTVSVQIPRETWNRIVAEGQREGRSATKTHWRALDAAFPPPQATPHAANGPARGSVAGEAERTPAGPWASCDVCGFGFRDRGICGHMDCPMKLATDRPSRVPGAAR